MEVIMLCTLTLAVMDGYDFWHNVILHAMAYHKEWAMSQEQGRYWEWKLSQGFFLFPSKADSREILWNLWNQLFRTRHIFGRWETWKKKMHWVFKCCVSQNWWNNDLVFITDNQSAYLAKKPWLVVHIKGDRNATFTSVYSTVSEHKVVTLFYYHYQNNAESK